MHGTCMNISPCAPYWSSRKNSLPPRTGERTAISLNIHNHDMIAGVEKAASVPRARFYRIPDVFDLVELDIAQAIPNFLDAAKIDSLDDVARIRIDSH